MSVWKLRTIGTPRRHAEDYTDDVILVILQELYALNPWTGVVGTLMCYTGLRYCDLSYLEPYCVEVGPKMIRIDITQSKVIRSELLRTELVIPAHLAPPAAFDELVKHALQWIRSKRTPTLAPRGTVGPINDLLRKVWSSREGRAPTTYTFRRSAFRRFIADCQNSDGVVNWKKVATYSLHFNAQTVQAFYHLGAGKHCRIDM